MQSKLKWQKSDFVTLKCPSIGNFKVFASSYSQTRNRIECSHLSNAAIPLGSYWIVDRPKGGVRSQMIALIQGFVSGNNRNDSFAFYCIDEILTMWRKYRTILVLVFAIILDRIQEHLMAVSHLNINRITMFSLILF